VNSPDQGPGELRAMTTPSALSALSRQNVFGVPSQVASDVFTINNLGEAPCFDNASILGTVTFSAASIAAASVAETVVRRMRVRIE
jgi:hypothetical protein